MGIVTEVFIRISLYWRGMRTALHRKACIAFVSYRALPAEMRKRFDIFAESLKSYFLKGIFCTLSSLENCIAISILCCLQYICLQYIFYRLWKCQVVRFFPHCFMLHTFAQNHVNVCTYKNQGNESVLFKTPNLFLTLKDAELYDWTDEAHLGCRAKEDRF